MYLVGSPEQIYLCEGWDDEMGHDRGRRGGGGGREGGGEEGREPTVGHPMKPIIKEVYSQESTPPGPR